MESLLSETAKQVPSLTVLAAVVWLFLRQMTEARAEYLAAIRDLQHDNHDARAVMHNVIKENTEVTKGLTNAIANLQAEIRTKLKRA